VLAQIGNDQALLDRSLRLSSFEYVKLVRQRAADQDVVGVFSALDEPGRRTRAFEAAERTAAWLGDPARGERGAPDIVVVADDSGKVLARNADRNRMYGTKLDTALSAVRATLQDGEARHGVWKKADEAKLLELAVAAIRTDSGQIAGVLVVGYDFSNGLAATEGKRLGAEVAFVVDDKVYSSSAPDQVARDLRGYLFGPGKAATDAAKNGTPSSPWVATLSGDEYAGVLAPLPSGLDAKVAYAVFNNRSSAASVANDATKIILALTLVFSLVVLVYGFMLGNSIVRPIEEIEEGVLAVINGNTDLRLDTKNPELGGLAYRINQLLNVFTGVQETPDEDDQAGGAVQQQDWKDSAFGDGQPAGAGSAAASGGGSSEPIDDPALAAKLSAEPEAAYYARVFKEYVAAKQAVGENINIPEDRFTQRLKGNEQALAKKHGAKGVRFVVQRSDNQVVLQPVLLK
jgi:HAMP domain-containing protein